jgi:DNA-binding transcriptional LysR family regulator
MAFDLRDLEVFLAVTEHGSFGRAATELAMAQPSVSVRVRNLERSVGTRLFTRSAKGVTLTAGGEVLLPYARRCVTVADEAAEAVRTADGAPRLRIAAHSTFMHRVVPMVLDALGDSRYRINVRDAHSEEVEAMVLDGVVDLGFVLPGPTRRGLRQMHLAPDPVVCVVAPDHPLVTGRPCTFTALATSYLAINAWGKGCATFLERVERAAIPEWRIRFVSDAATAASLARNEGHVAIVTRSAVQADRDRGALVALPLRGFGRWTVPLAGIYRSADGRDPAIEAVRAACAASARAPLRPRSRPG